MFNRSHKHSKVFGLFANTQATEAKQGVIGRIGIYSNVIHTMQFSRAKTNYCSYCQYMLKGLARATLAN